MPVFARNSCPDSSIAACSAQNKLARVSQVPAEYWRGLTFGRKPGPSNDRVLKCGIMERSVKLTPHARAALLFAAVYLVHAPMPVSLQGDSRWTIHTALSLIHGRGGDLRAYSPAIVANQFYGIECVEADYSRRFPIYSLQECSGDLYNFYPVAVATLAVPFVAVLEASSSAARPILAPLASHRPWVRPFIAGDLAGASAIVENLIASLFTAGAVTALYLAALELLPPASALVLVLVFAFGTLLWSLVSRALWAHGPSVFVNSLVLFLLVRGKYRSRTLTAVGIPARAGVLYPAHQRRTGAGDRHLSHLASAQPGMVGRGRRTAAHGLLHAASTCACTAHRWLRSSIP